MAELSNQLQKAQAGDFDLASLIRLRAQGGPGAPQAEPQPMEPADELSVAAPAPAQPAPQAPAPTQNFDLMGDITSTASRVGSSLLSTGGQMLHGAATAYTGLGGLILKGINATTFNSFSRVGILDDPGKMMGLLVNEGIIPPGQEEFWSKVWKEAGSAAAVLPLTTAVASGIGGSAGWQAAMNALKQKGLPGTIAFKMLYPLRAYFDDAGRLGLQKTMVNEAMSLPGEVVGSETVAEANRLLGEPMPEWAAKMAGAGVAGMGFNATRNVVQQARAARMQTSSPEKRTQTYLSRLEGERRPDYESRIAQSKAMSERIEGYHSTYADVTGDRSIEGFERSLIAADEEIGREYARKVVTNQEAVAAHLRSAELSIGQYHDPRVMQQQAAAHVGHITRAYEEGIQELEQGIADQQRAMMGAMGASTDPQAAMSAQGRNLAEATRTVEANRKALNDMLFDPINDTMRGQKVFNSGGLYKTMQSTVRERGIENLEDVVAKSRTLKRAMNLFDVKKTKRQTGFRAGQQRQVTQAEGTLKSKTEPIDDDTVRFERAADVKQQGRTEFTRESSIQAETVTAMRPKAVEYQDLRNFIKSWNRERPLLERQIATGTADLDVEDALRLGDNLKAAAQRELNRLEGDLAAKFPGAADQYKRAMKISATTADPIKSGLFRKVQKTNKWGEATDGESVQVGYQFLKDRKNMQDFKRVYGGFEGQLDPEMGRMFRNDVAMGEMDAFARESLTDWIRTKGDNLTAAHIEQWKRNNPGYAELPMASMVEELKRSHNKIATAKQMLAEQEARFGKRKVEDLQFSVATQLTQGRRPEDVMDLVMSGDNRRAKFSAVSNIMREDPEALKAWKKTAWRYFLDQSSERLSEGSAKRSFLGDIPFLSGDRMLQYLDEFGPELKALYTPAELKIYREGAEAASNIQKQIQRVGLPATDVLAPDKGKFTFREKIVQAILHKIGIRGALVSSPGHVAVMQLQKRLFNTLQEIESTELRALAKSYLWDPEAAKIMADMGRKEPQLMIRRVRGWAAANRQLIEEITQEDADHATAQQVQQAQAQAPTPTQAPQQNQPDQLQAILGQLLGGAR